MNSYNEKCHGRFFRRTARSVLGTDVGTLNERIARQQLLAARCHAAEP